MTSGVKCSSSRYGRQASTFFLGISPPSMRSFSPFRLSMNLSMLPMSLVAAPQDLSLGLLLSRMTITAVTSSTPAGGFFSALASPRSFLLSVSSAASAASTSGWALSRSACTEDCLAETSSWMTAHFAASTWAASFSMFALSFSTPTFSAKASAEETFSSTSTAFTLAASTSTATSFSVASSLSRPFCRRVMAVWVLSRLVPSRFL
mmetsp:Transcript_2470/g.8782  ORF Transcript_2470/g.8782 Transcript_2470/m.8782 type:complete len:206 (-) Transcript_2470:3567-4184(-)